MKTRVMALMRPLSALIFAIAATATAAASENALYAVTVSVHWSDDEDAARAPENPHWSRLLATTHDARYVLFADGDTASSGLALMAKNGRVSVLEAELAEARRRGRAGAHVVVDGLRGGVGEFTFEIDVTAGDPLISLATMLAPSPDWFAGVSAAALRDETGWRDLVEAPLWVWDAGADSGETFTAPNAETQPRQSVRLLAHPAFLRSDGLRPIGEATFRRIR